MLYVESDGTIRLTRGDTAYLTVPIKYDSNNQAYTLAATDKLDLTIKKSVRDTTAVVHKTVTGNNIFHIVPNDTKDLSFGKYIYDVQLTTAGSDVYTVIEPTTFEILKEVTC